MSRLHALSCLVLIVFRQYAYGDHVQDPRAFSLRLTRRAVNRLAVASMRCTEAT